MSASELPSTIDPRMTAGIALARRTGAQAFQLRYSDDEQPVVWMAVVSWRVGADGRPVKSGGVEAHDVAAAMSPPLAVMRLLDQIVDGGTCSVCARSTTVLHEHDASWPVERVTCVWRYEPTSEHYVRSCDGKVAT